MITGDLLLQISLSTQNPQQNYPAPTPHKYPMNGNWENTGKMEAVYEETEDKTMEEGSLDSTGTIPT